ncbi:NUDIX domain-containing protein [Alicyclobacillus acidiphilus]|uniref:NUDIX domain-containing protein n=1 Tax=Alicyclobacillus acidiphilus TaxID=182455 RepID=UPI000834CE9F|nr:NUDIX hydrolase [Alicyclobacillus acidiphilus]
MERRGDWTITQTREAYRNPWIRVVEHQVIRPDGSEGIYGVIDAGHNAGTVVIDDDDNIVLLEEFVFPLGVTTLQIPSGQYRDGESPLAAAKRELAEETGIAAANWIDLGKFALSGGISTQMSHVFLARELSYGESHLEETEQIVVRKVPLCDAIDMCMTSHIVDSVSLVGIFRAAAWLRKNDNQVNSGNTSFGSQV